jgi:hypothetical protein
MREGAATWPQREVRDAAETIAFHFMRAFLVENPKGTPRKLGHFWTFGKMGKTQEVKR